MRGRITGSESIKGVIDDVGHQIDFLSARSRHLFDLRQMDGIVGPTVAITAMRLPASSAFSIIASFGLRIGTSDSRMHASITWRNAEQVKRSIGAAPDHVTREHPEYVVHLGHDAARLAHPREQAVVEQIAHVRVRPVGCKGAHRGVHRVLVNAEEKI